MKTPISFLKDKYGSYRLYDDDGNSIGMISSLIDASDICIVVNQSILPDKPILWTAIGEDLDKCVEAIGIKRKICETDGDVRTRALNYMGLGSPEQIQDHMRKL